MKEYFSHGDLADSSAISASKKNLQKFHIDKKNVGDEIDYNFVNI